MLRYLHMVCSNLADKATPAPDRYSRREIRTVPAVDIAQLRKQVDALGKEHRLLDLEVQAANWLHELV